MLAPSDLHVFSRRWTEMVGDLSGGRSLPPMVTPPLSAAVKRERKKHPVLAGDRLLGHLLVLGEMLHLGREVVDVGGEAGRPETYLARDAAAKVDYWMPQLMPGDAARRAEAIRLVGEARVSSNALTHATVDKLGGRAALFVHSAYYIAPDLLDRTIRLCGLVGVVEHEYVADRGSMMWQMLRQHDNAVVAREREEGNFSVEAGVVTFRCRGNVHYYKHRSKSTREVLEGQGHFVDMIARIPWYQNGVVVAYSQCFLARPATDTSADLRSAVAHVARLAVGTARPVGAAERIAGEVSKLVRDGKIALEDSAEVVSQAVPKAADIQADIAKHVGAAYGRTGWASWLLGLPGVRAVAEKWLAPSRWARRVLEDEQDFALNWAWVRLVKYAIAFVALCGGIGVLLRAYGRYAAMLGPSGRAKRVPVISSCAETPTEMVGPHGAVMTLQPDVAMECDKRGHHGISPNGLGLPVGPTKQHNCPVTQAAAISGRIFKCFRGASEAGKLWWQECRLRPVEEQYAPQDDAEWLSAYNGPKLRRKEAGLQEQRMVTVRDINVKAELTTKGTTGEVCTGGDSLVSVQTPRPITSCDATVSRAYRYVASWSKYNKKQYCGEWTDDGYMPVYAIGYNADQLGALHTRCCEFVEAGLVKPKTAVVFGELGERVVGDAVAFGEVDDGLVEWDNLAKAGIRKLNTDASRYDSTIDETLDLLELGEMRRGIVIPDKDHDFMRGDLVQTTAVTKYLRVFFKGRRRSGDDVTSCFNSKHMLRFWQGVHKSVHHSWNEQMYRRFAESLNREGIANMWVPERVAEYDKVVPPRLAMMVGGDDSTGVVASCWYAQYLETALQMAREIGWTLEENAEDGFYSGYWVPCDVFEVQMPAVEWPLAQPAYTLESRFYLSPKPGRAWAKFSNCCHDYDAPRMRKWAVQYIAGVRGAWSRCPVLRTLVEVYSPLIGGETGEGMHAHSPYAAVGVRPIEWSYWEDLWSTTRAEIERLEAIIRRDAFECETLSVDEHPLVEVLSLESGYPLDTNIGSVHHPAASPEYRSAEQAARDAIGRRIAYTLVGSLSVGTVVPLYEEMIHHWCAKLGPLGSVFAALAHAWLEVPQTVAGGFKWGHALLYRLVLHGALCYVRMKHGFRAGLLAHVVFNNLAVLYAVWVKRALDQGVFATKAACLTMVNEKEKSKKATRAAEAEAILKMERNKGKVGNVSGYSSAGDTLSGLIRDQAGMNLAFLQNIVHPGSHPGAGRLPDGYTVAPTAVVKMKTTGTIIAAGGNILFRLYPSIKQGLGMATGTASWGVVDSGGFFSWQQYASLASSIKQYRFTGLGCEIRFLGNLTNCQGTFAEGAQAPGASAPASVAAIAALPDSRTGTVAEMFAAGGSYYTYWCPVSGDTQTTLAAASYDWMWTEFSNPTRDASVYAMPAIVCAFEGLGDSVNPLIQVTCVATLEVTASTTIFDSSVTKPDVEAIDGVKALFTDAARDQFAGVGLGHAHASNMSKPDFGAHPASTVSGMVNSFLGNHDVLRNVGSSTLRALKAVAPYGKMAWDYGKFLGPLVAAML